jgi:hypothetical protein
MRFLPRLSGPICVAALAWLATLGGVLAASPVIKFHTARAGYVSINIYNSEGVLVRSLLSNERMVAGAHVVSWDGKSTSTETSGGEAVAPGDYAWRGLFSEGLGLKLRGWVGSGGGLPWTTPDGKGGWGGDKGAPSAVAADDKQVYLGWSMAAENASVLACDLDGRVLWKFRREDGSPSGCKALAVDDGIVYVLGGGDNGQGRDVQYADGESIYRLSAQDGKLLPWPNGEANLKITSLWPPDGKTKPNAADAMAVRHGHIHLSFTGSQFLSVLDAKTGAYLQTVVGAPPGMIDVAPTQTELPDAPGKVVDADFALISLGGGVLGRILFVHDPFWVIMSDLVPTEADQSITALTVVGDRAKFHHHTAYVGYGAPLHQVQARPLLDTESTIWTGGRAGGRPLVGPWVPDALRAIRGVALAADGKLWVAEGEAFPKRFSVWDTNGTQGKLLDEFFGSPVSSAPDGAINPLDPDVMAAQNCEWRIDRKTGAATCLGVIARDQIFSGTHYAVGPNGHAYLIASYFLQGGPPLRIFERLGDGDYKLRARVYATLEDGKEATVDDYPSDKLKNTVFWADKNGDGKEQPDELTVVPEVLRIDPPSDLRNLDLQFRYESGETWMLPVVGWTSCGAPQYDPEKRRKLPPHTHSISADGKLGLVSKIDDRPVLACFDVESGRERWEVPSTHADVSAYETKDGRHHREELAGGGAYLPAPLKNVWAVGECGGRWRVVNEDGFILGHLFEPDDVKWPAAAKPGADLSTADSRVSGVGSLTQAANGKVYIEAGRDAYWNLELTGLEKVKALPGGKIAIPPPK